MFNVLLKTSQSQQRRECVSARERGGGLGCVCVGCWRCISRLIFDCWREWTIDGMHGSDESGSSHVSEADEMKMRGVTRVLNFLTLLHTPIIYWFIIMYGDIGP